jgi:hypothetical protein
VSVSRSSRGFSTWLRIFRRSKKKSRLETEEVKEALNEVQNSIYERCQAQRQLSTLAERAERDSAPMLPLAASTELAIASEVEINQQLIKSTGPTLRQIDSYAGSLSGSNDRALIMQKTSSWVAQLYSQWTTLSEEVPLFDEATIADLTAETESETAFREHSTIKASQSTADLIVPEPLEVEQEDLSIHFEDGYHQYGVGTKCNCVRAMLKIPMSLQRELRDLDMGTSRWLDVSFPYKSPTASFLQRSERRNELEHTFNAQYLLPLYKKYLARLSDSLAVSDSELAELYRRSEDMKGAERHSAEAEVAARVAKRQRLSLLVKHNAFCTRESKDGTLYLEPSDCWQPQRKTTEQPDGTATSSGGAGMQLDPEMIFNMMGGSMDNTRKRQAPASIPKSGGYSTDTPTSTRSQTMPYKRTDGVARVETPPMKYSESSDATRGNGSDPEARDTDSRKLRPEGMYNERNRDDYFGSRERFNSSIRGEFEDKAPRVSARKYEVPDEEERRSSTKTSESGKSKKSAWDAGASGMSLKMGLEFQAKAKSARDRVSERKEQEKREKELDKEKKAAKAKFRDRLDKAHRRVYVEDDSSSDSDTATQVTDATVRGPRVETVRPSSKSSPRSSIRQEEPRRSSERSRRHRDDDDDDEYKASRIPSVNVRPSARAHKFRQTSERRPGFDAV